jgi:hypothetical protein
MKDDGSKAVAKQNPGESGVSDGYHITPVFQSPAVNPSPPSMASLVRARIPRRFVSIITV